MNRLLIAPLCADSEMAQNAPSTLRDRQRIGFESVAYGLPAKHLTYTCHSFIVRDWHERWTPTQLWVGVAVWIANAQARQSVMRCWAYQHGHLRMSRAIP